MSYWNSKRMLTAIPVATPVLKGNANPRVQIPQEGGAVKIQPVASIFAKNNSKTKAVKDIVAGKLSPNLTYPFPFTRHEVPNNGYTYTWPYSVEGKVFFTDSRTGSNYVCSGTSVNSLNGSVVDTAGHCVVQGGSGSNWYTNWVFCPGYKDGYCPYGVWTARQLWSYSYWSSNGWFEYDLGAAVMNKNSYGYTLNSWVGGSGEAWNYPRGLSYAAIGYPQAAPFTGNRMFECDAVYATADTPSPGSQPAMGIGCDMTGGSSGGAWLIYNSSSGGYVNGHNDYKYSNQPLAMYSPYYGNEAYAVYNAAQHS
ncbi:MAG TPA: hypothetical protein VFN23_13270 [Ktedonobacteraceae bacterium]|nr:hypothetical protein [Ktedonobacteraceae bacterium]